MPPGPPLCPSLDLDRRDWFTGKAMHAAKDKGTKGAFALHQPRCQSGPSRLFQIRRLLRQQHGVPSRPVGNHRRMESAAHPSALPNAHSDEILGIDKTDAAKLAAAMLAYFDFKGFSP